MALVSGLLLSQTITGSSITSEAATGTWKHDKTGWWYSYGGGSYAKNAWIKSGGKWYYFGANGYMVTGWKKIGGKWYYFCTDGYMVTGTQTIGGTVYKVFLLSFEEAKVLFGNDQEKRTRSGRCINPIRNCVPTKYVIEKGDFYNEYDDYDPENDGCKWWLRTPGKRNVYASIVDVYGNLFDSRQSAAHYNAVEREGFVVRPALRINPSLAVVSGE